MAFVLLVGLGVALFALAAQPERRPRLLGPMSAKTPVMAAAAGGPDPGPVRGIGRFARPRVGPPKRL